jgi:hypothetical protein
MDITKWKSVAVKLEDWKIMQGLCEKKKRSTSSMISKLLHDYVNYLASKEKIDSKTLIKKLINGKH